jgi:hypothetical protein
VLDRVKYHLRVKFLPSRKWGRTVFATLSGNVPDMPYFIILLCPMPDNFIHQEVSAATQWAKSMT